MAEARHIVLGVTGSIAAYKAVDLARLLTHAGHQVHVVLTREAQEFVRPLPFQVLTRQPVVVDLYQTEQGWKPLHIGLADEVDLFLVAPATAAFLARWAMGLADDALGGIALALRPAARCLVAPAMNGRMWQHPATQSHVRQLREWGVEFIGPDQGELSCGYEGVGRLWPVEGIAERALALLS